MTTNSTRTGGWNPAALANDLATAWRLLRSPQVPTALKVLLPAAAALYWVSPIDLLPGLPIDDIALMIIALKLFVQMAPDVSGPATGGQAAGDARRGNNANGNATGDVVDTTWSVVED